MASDNELVEKAKKLMGQPERIRNICTSAHIHHGKTALTDNLLAAAGFMSRKAAGSLEAGMATWLHLDEQERLMTVDAANLSMCHTFDGNDYLINMIDTPGHVDFGGNVTRAMRAIDGTIVLICGVEGIMPQTETVIRQALRERVKPVLFINKCDRLIMELKLSPEQIQARLSKLIIQFNQLVERLAEKEFKEKFKVNIADGSVCFGSARENWALSLPYMKKKNVSFKDILSVFHPDVSDVSEEQRQEWIWKNAPLFDVVLDMVIKHLPNPMEAQKYRIPHIWRGELDSPFGQDLLTCNPNGKIGFVITRITIDPKFGREISAGRLFSGTVREGMTVYLNDAKQSQRVAQVYTYMGVKPESVGEVPAGNILALGGVSGYAGETITLEPEHPFEELKHIFEPVITKSIQPEKQQDIPKLVEILRKVAKEDPSIKVEINQETGENLISGMGELHLEIIENRIITERKFPIKTSPPIVVFRESIMKKSPQDVEGKSPNKHNKLYFLVEPVPPAVQELIKSGALPEGRIKKKNVELRDKFVEAGIETKVADKIKDIFRGNLFIDGTRGIVYITEIIEMVLDMFEDVMKQGPLAREPCVNVIVTMTDCKLHEDAIHRGPGQMYPAVREGIKGAMITATPVIFEPKQLMLFEAPEHYMGEISKLVANKRGQLIDMITENNMVHVKAKMPVAEMFGFESELRSATEGRGTSSIIDQVFEKLPEELQGKIIGQVRTRKKLGENQ